MAAEYGIGPGDIDWLRRPATASVPADGITARPRLAAILRIGVPGVPVWRVVGSAAAVLLAIVCAVLFFRWVWPLVILVAVLVVASTVESLARVVRVRAGEIRLLRRRVRIDTVTSVLPVRWITGSNVTWRLYLLGASGGAVLRLDPGLYARDEISRVLALFVGRYADTVDQASSELGTFARKHEGVLSWWERRGTVIAAVLLVVAFLATAANIALQAR